MFCRPETFSLYVLQAGDFLLAVPSFRGRCAKPVFHRSLQLVAEPLVNALTRPSPTV
jgi:hypothetical protein